MNEQDTKEWRTDIEAMKSQSSSDKLDHSNMITREQAAAELEILLDRYDWFHSSAVDKSKRIVVYVNTMSPDTLRLIPDPFYGHSVIVAFASFLLCGEKYGTGGSGKSVLKQYVKDE
jgi:hypothetical protein